MKLPKFRFHSPFAALYAEAQLLPDIRRSMMFVLCSNIFGNMFMTICGSGTTAMIQLSNFLGAGDLEYGIITGIPMAAALLQIPFSMLVTRTQKRRKYLVTYGLFSRALWLLFGLVPFIIPEFPLGFRLWTIIFLLGISSCCGSFINVCWMPWMADLLPMRIRGRWLSNRDTINSVFGVVVGLLIAFILDNVDGPIRYTIVFLLGGTFGVVDMLCYFFVKEVYRAAPTKNSFRKTAKQIWLDKPFLRFIIFWTAWCFTANMCGSYLVRYSINEMGLSNLQATIFSNISACAITVVVISLWGRALDRYGCKPVMWISGLVAAITPAFFLFSTPGSPLPLFLHSFIGAAFWSASNLAATSMQLTYSPDEQRPAYVAFFSCVTSLVGAFAGILTGGAMLDFMEWMGVSGNTGFDRYKILITIATVLRLATVIFLVPPMENDRDSNAVIMTRDFLAWGRRRWILLTLRLRKRS